MEKINIFVPAAGFGERLRPITDLIPKPLLPILGKPVLEKVLERISVLPVEHICINMHYKWEMIRDWALASPFSGKIRLFHEDPVLGTGGALKNAAGTLSEAIFLVYNSDILSDINLGALIERHLSSGNIATLAVHDWPLFNNVWLDQEGRLKAIGKDSPEKTKGLRRLAFTGIAAYSPDFLEFLPDRESSVVDAWLAASSSGQKVGSLDFTGCRWCDIGTPDAYFAVVLDSLKEDGEAVYVNPSAWCSRAEMGGNVVLEKGSVVEGDPFLRNCIVLPGSSVQGGLNLENCIAGPGFIINILQNKIAGPSSSPLIKDYFGHSDLNAEITPIGTGGSDRRYFRVSAGNKTAVLMECNMDDPDYHRHVVYTKFMKRYAVPVPELLGEDKEEHARAHGKRRLLFEDLGDISLYSWLKCAKEPAKIERTYKLVLDILINLHSTVTGKVSECQLLGSRLFDYEHLRWETDYFFERFITGEQGINVQDADALKQEFSDLAEKVASFGKTIVHRDFQSQNIMVRKGGIPRVIDYQGARMGPPAYDLASILWDPYHSIESDMRDSLIAYYIEGMKAAGSLPDEDGFRQTVLPCRLQRHMQALGAYGFLTKEKGKKYFLKHIPQALLYLKEEAEIARAEYPVLHALVLEIYGKAGY